MTDLQEIKADVAPFGPDEKAWLIAEVERLEQQLAGLQKEHDSLKRVDRVTAEALAALRAKAASK